MPRRITIIVAAIALTALAANAADDFYDLQLQTGKIDFAAGRAVQAADEFRIAAFGFLDRPPLLSEALARLALAQASLGQTSLVQQTLARFVDLEQRFAAYDKSALDNASRTKFQALLLSTVQPETLKTLPSLTKLVKTPIEQAADLPMQQRIAAYEAGFRRESRNVEWPLALMRLYATTGDQGDVARWAHTVLGIDSRNTEARALLIHADASRGNCRDALADFNHMNAADLQSRNDLFGDAGVCFVETGKWAEAKEAFAKLSEQGRGRADVKKAMQKIADRDAATAAVAKEAAKETAKLAPASALAKTPGQGTSQTAPKATAPSAPTSTLRAIGTTAAPGPSTSSKGPTTAETLNASRALVQGGKFAEAEKLLRTAVQTDPSSRQLRLALLEAAVLSRDWRTGAAQFASTQPFAPGEELFMFYAAVALYESGRHDEARPLMEKAKPRMVSSPMVDYYLDAILGTSD